MILIDSSAWIEFLRDTATPACVAVDRLLVTGFATCDPIRMEILAGARDERHLDQLRRLLARGSMLQARPADYEEAAALYRSCRRGGETVRRMIDCLIAAVALRSGARVLHADADFDVLTRHCGLLVEPAP
ncbi:MAG: type II toxin-antitoxin system VapC family toxin [Acidimicrobiales bacterium]